jgi:hypothetical protein
MAALEHITGENRLGNLQYMVNKHLKEDTDNWISEESVCTCL